MKKIFDIFATVIMALVIVFAFLLAGVRIFGLTPYTVLSGSMEPSYHVGSLIYVRQIDPDELRVGDPVTYMIEGGTVVTHRIVEVITDDNDPTSLSFRTKGDNNDTPDGDPISANNVIGKPVFTVPLIGYVAVFVQNPPGSYFVIGILAALLILAFMPDILNKLLGPTEDGKAEDEKTEDGKAEDGSDTADPGKGDGQAGN